MKTAVCSLLSTSLDSIIHRTSPLWTRPKSRPALLQFASRALVKQPSFPRHCLNSYLVWLLAASGRGIDISPQFHSINTLILTTAGPYRRISRQNNSSLNPLLTGPDYLSSSLPHFLLPPSLPAAMSHERILQSSRLSPPPPSSSSASSA